MNLVAQSKLNELRKTRDEMSVHVIQGIFGVVTQVMHGPPSMLIARLYASVLSTQLPLLKTLDDYIRRFEN